MERKMISVYALMTAFIIGVIGNILFYDMLDNQYWLHPGLSFPIFIGVAVTSALGLVFLAKKRLWWRNLWVIVPMFFFAGMVAIRAEVLMTGLNILAVLALGALGLHYLTLMRPLDEDGTETHISGMLQAGIYSSVGAINEVGHSISWLRERDWKDLGPLASVGRGLLFALPVVAVFGVLLSSADEVFADVVGGIFAFDELESIVARVLVTLVIAWVSAGALAYGAAGFLRHLSQPSEATDDEAHPQQPADEIEEDGVRKRSAGFRLNMIESGIVMGSVITLFALFVFIQFAYLFGGQEVIREGLTYAEYARRGFFELVAVSVLVLGMGLALDNLTVRRGVKQGVWFKGLSVLLVCLTLVILLSAWQRMYLYEEAFGFTHLRIYTHVFMIAIAALLGVFLLHIFRVKKAIFSLGVLLVMIGYLGLLNLLNVEQFIAQRNIDRWQAGSSLDLCYLRTFSVDALPAMLALYEAAEPQSDAWILAVRWLSEQHHNMRYWGEERTPLNSHWSLDRALHTLQAMGSALRADLTRVQEIYPNCFIRSSEP